MYFHTDKPNVITRLKANLEHALNADKRVRIDVDHEGNLRIKIGEGMWSEPIVSTPDPYRDQTG